MNDYIDKDNDNDNEKKIDNTQKYIQALGSDISVIKKDIREVKNYLIYAKSSIDYEYIADENLKKSLMEYCEDMDKCYQKDFLEYCRYAYFQIEKIINYCLKYYKVKILEKKSNILENYYKIKKKGKIKKEIDEVSFESFEKLDANQKHLIFISLCFDASEDSVPDIFRKAYYFLMNIHTARNDKSHSDHLGNVFYKNFKEKKQYRLVKDFLIDFCKGSIIFFQEDKKQKLPEVPFYGYNVYDKK